jgi:hypothetical protein
MRGTGDDMRVGNGVVLPSKDLARDQAREVRHIDHQERPVLATWEIRSTNHNVYPKIAGAKKL